MGSLAETQSRVNGTPQYESDDSNITRQAIYEAFNSARAREEDEGRGAK